MSTSRWRIRRIAGEAFLAIGASGFARVDFLLSRDGLLYVSEINTIPGFTPISLFPRLCELGGYDFGGMCERIVALALERAALAPARRLTRARPALSRCGLRRRGVAGRRPEPARLHRAPPETAALGAHRGCRGAVAVGGALFWLTRDPAFAVDPRSVRVDGALYRARGCPSPRMNLTGCGARPTVFISTRSMEEAIEQLPTVRHAPA